MNSNPTDELEEIANEAIIQGMVAMQLSMTDGKPGRHEKVIKDLKAKLNQLILEKQLVELKWAKGASVWNIEAHMNELEQQLKELKEGTE